MESVKFPSHGGFSVRSILTFALAAMIAAFLWITFSSSPALAVGDARWSGESIILDNHGFSAASDFQDTTGTIPAGSTIYKTPIKNQGTGASVSQKVFIIYFTPGVDPPTATSANYVEFSYNDGQHTNPQNQQDINLTLKSQQTAGTSCAVEGVGWFICPISVFLASAMDSIFDVLSGMIETQPPILGDTSNSMYVAWNVMRTVANIAFVIAFLIIIYSQLTSIGVSNYGLKKLIPRLIIAAVLVNVSFYIAALAIDISNILGYSIQDIFNGIRESVFRLTNDDLGATLQSPWAAVTTVILAGGGLYAGVFYMATGGLYLLLPLLLGLLLTIILVVIILAARQAIILILVIIAPLAFVANLLPNTEKWFDKWKDLFMTMLIFFPAFSLVFGGSQLAGQLIIQNAGDSIVMVLFGLAVQIAPLVITPLILKLSGGLLGRIAQISNNPKKGLIDRNRNWAAQRAEHAKNQNIARGPRLRNPSSWGAGAVRRAEFKKRRLSDNTDIWKQAATNRYEESPEINAINERRAATDIDKGRIHDDHAAHVEGLKTQQGTPLHQAAMRAQVSKDKLETQQQHLSGYYNTLRTVGGTDLNTSSNNLEAAKGNNEASEQNKAAYLNEQRTFRTTQLGAAAERLEAAKLNSESMQSTYTAHIDSLKVKPDTTISNAAILAQSNKEHAEGAQTRVQAMFDAERKIDGSKLNVSTLNLEGAKIEAGEAKDLTAAYINEAKSRSDGVLHVQTARGEAAKFTAQGSESMLKSVIEEYKAGAVPGGATPELSAIIEQLSDGRQSLAIEQRRTDNATKVQNERLADALINDQALRTYAGGINDQGADSALAGAVNTVRTAYGQSVNEARQIIKHFNVSSGDRQKLALLKTGESITITRDDGTTHEFKASDIFAREAAIEDQVAVGTIDQVEAIVMESGIDSNGNKSLLADYRTTIAEALAKNGLGGKSLYLGGKTIDDVAKGRINGKEDILALAVEAIGKGKISEKDLANIDPIAVGRLLEAAQRIKSGNIPALVDTGLLPDLHDRMVDFSEVARKVLASEESVSIKTKARPYIEEIGRLDNPTP